MNVNYLIIESTLEQDLQAEMNIIDREFIAKGINAKKWDKRQIKAIKKYRKKILNHEQ